MSHHMTINPLNEIVKSSTSKTIFVSKRIKKNFWFTTRRTTSPTSKRTRPHRRRKTTTSAKTLANCSTLIKPSSSKLTSPKYKTKNHAFDPWPHWILVQMLLWPKFESLFVMTQMTNAHELAEKKKNAQHEPHCP